MQINCVCLANRLLIFSSIIDKRSLLLGARDFLGSCSEDLNPFLSIKPGPSLFKNEFASYPILNVKDVRFLFYFCALLFNTFE